MQKKQVAVIDIRSRTITAVIAERGINKTFVIKSTNEFTYDGFSDGTFYDQEQFVNVLKRAINCIISSSIKNISTILIGVPSHFTHILIKDGQISFSKKKKITGVEMDELFDSAFNLKSDKFTLINRSAILYELDDCRRMANPYGTMSEILKGKLSFVSCDNYFINLVNIAFETFNGIKPEFASTSLAQALYLVDTESRDRLALILDVGYISTTFTIIQGDGILFEKEFPYGAGYISGNFVEKFDIEFSTAEKLRDKINLSTTLDSGAYSVIECDDQIFSSIEINDVVIASLDSLCEQVTLALNEFNFNIPEYVPLLLTGDGITKIRGAKEHIAGRLGMSIKVIVPNVPLLNKPDKSSLLSLLDLALEQN